MSWDVIVYNSDHIPESLDDSDPEDELPLGTPAEVRALISKTLTTTIWGEDGSGVYDGGDNLFIEIYPGDEDPVANIFMSVKALDEIRACQEVLRILKAGGWWAMDCSSDEILAPE